MTKILEVKKERNKAGKEKQKKKWKEGMQNGKERKKIGKRKANVKIKGRKTKETNKEIK